MFIHRPWQKMENADRFHRKRKVLKTISKGTSVFKNEPLSIKGGLVEKVDVRKRSLVQFYVWFVLEFNNLAVF